MSKDNILIIIYFLSFAVFVIAEIVMHRKFSIMKSPNKEKSFMLFVIPFFISICLAPLEYVVLEPKLPLALIIAGFILLYGAIILRIISFNTIGNNFSAAIEVKTDSNLVVKGIYKYIRHPLYFSIFLINVSVILIFACLIMWIFVLLTFIGILIRIKKEEAFLVSHYPEYKQYQKGTKKLIPWIY